MKRVISILSLVLMVVACTNTEAQEPSPVITPSTVPLSDKFLPPAGFVVSAGPTGSFAWFLSKLPIRTERTHVESFKGERLNSPSAGIVKLDVGERDLQQCADSVIRLHAEWLWSQDRADSVGYHFTSGDLSTWKAWRAGERYLVSGSKVKRVKSGRDDASYENFRDYLFHTFRYAGTRSLRFDSDPVEVDDVQAGDFFVHPGSPGHAIIVLAVAKNDRGEKRLLLGQGFMPAQDFHVIKSASAEDGVWFTPPSDSKSMKTPSWQAFPKETLRRFKK